MSDQLATIYQEIKVWERVAHVNIIKIFELYDDLGVPEMYLLMEFAKFGQIQFNNESDTGDLTRHNLEILEVATAKGAKIWPTKKDKPLELACRWIFYQVALAMEYLHDTLNTVHRDLKHENILMGLKSGDPMNEDERQNTIKVCDFTTATRIPAGENSDKCKLVTNAGTLAFNAPEEFSQHEFLAKPLDVWSFGICIFVYLTNNLPVSHLSKDLQKVI